MIKVIDRYSPEEVLRIFKEQHRLCSPLDIEADRNAEITGEMSIRDWRSANDLLGWKELSMFLNKEFRLTIDENTWQQTLEPAKKRNLLEVCELIAKHATIEYFQPKIIFGQECLKANIFLTIKRNLKNKGVDVSELSPSSNLAFYINKYFSPVLEEITLTGTKPLKKLHTIRKKRKFRDIINFANFTTDEIFIEDVETFRDLVNKIIYERNQNTSKLSSQ